MLGRMPVAFWKWGSFARSCATHPICWEVLLSLDPKGLSSKSRAALW